jgi:hypothetical protein
LGVGSRFVAGIGASNLVCSTLMDNGHCQLYRAGSGSRPTCPRFVAGSLSPTLPTDRTGRECHSRGCGWRKNRRRVTHGLLTPLDPSLTLTRTQYPAMPGNRGNRNPFPMRYLQTHATPRKGCVSAAAKSSIWQDELTTLPKVGPPEGAQLTISLRFENGDAYDVEATDCR